MTNASQKMMAEDAYKWEMEHEGDCQEVSDFGFQSVEYLAVDGECILRFDDGSILSRSLVYRNGNDEPVFHDTAEFLEAVDATIDVIADKRKQQGCPSIKLEGTIAPYEYTDRPDITLKLTGITHCGEPYEVFGSTVWDEPSKDECPIIYTQRLAELVGKRVRITCTKEKYHEKRWTTRGNLYHVNVDFLNYADVIEVATPCPGCGEANPSAPTTEDIAKAEDARA